MTWNTNIAKIAGLVGAANSPIVNDSFDIKPINKDLHFHGCINLSQVSIIKRVEWAFNSYKFEKQKHEATKQ